MAGVSFVQKVTDTSGNNNATRTTTMPSSAGPPSIPVNGNLLLSVCTAQSSTSQAFTAPATNGGWSAADIQYRPSTSAATFATAVFHKTAASESGVAYVWTAATARAFEVCVLEVSGQDSATPVVGVGTAQGVSTLSAITTTRNSGLIVVGVIMDTAANTVTAVTDTQGNTYTQQEHIVTTSGTHDPNLYLFTAPQAAAGSTGTISLTVSGVATNNSAFAFAVQPPSSFTAHNLTTLGAGS